MSPQWEPKKVPGYFSKFRVEKCGNIIFPIHKTAVYCTCNCNRGESACLPRAAFMQLKYIEGGLETVCPLPLLAEQQLFAGPAQKRQVMPGRNAEDVNRSFQHDIMLGKQVSRSSCTPSWQLVRARKPPCSAGALGLQRPPWKSQ